MFSAVKIGAHLHPWVNPPFVESVSNYNSYPGNLPGALERAKLHKLTSRIEQSFERISNQQCRKKFQSLSWEQASPD